MQEEIPRTFRDKRPWGEELWIKSNPPSMVKIISVSPGEALSLQFHNLRDEYWHIISGNGQAQIGTDKIPLEPDSECFIPRGTNHRLYGGTQPLVLLELAFGNFDEKDIIRIEDKYGRT